MKKIRVGVLTGGASAERDISLATGAQIARELPPDRYDVVLLDPLAFMVRNPQISEELRAQARELLRGGARLDTGRQLPKGLEQEIESASKALVPATRFTCTRPCSWHRATPPILHGISSSYSAIRACVRVWVRLRATALPSASMTDRCVVLCCSP